MKRWIALLFLLLPAGLAFGRQEQSSKLASLVASAQQAEAQNNYTAAENDYKQAIRIRPDVPELWANLGLMQHEAGEYPEAVRSFEHALQMKPSLYAPTLFLGIDDTQLGKVRVAVSLLLKAEAMNTSDPLAPLSLGKAYTAQGEPALAIHAFRIAIARDPEQGTAWFELGMAQLHEVEDDARAMTSQYPDSPYTKALFAESLVQQSRYRQAADLYQSILPAAEQPPCMLSEAGLADLDLGDIPAASRAFSTERAQHPECPLALLGQASLDIRSGQNAAALTLAKQIWQDDHEFLDSNVSRLFASTPQEEIQHFLDYATQERSTAELSPALYTALTQPTSDQADSEAPKAGEPASAMPANQTAAARTRLQRARQLYIERHDTSCANLLQSSLESGDAATLETLAPCSFFAGEYNLTWDAGRALASLSVDSAEALYWSIEANEKLAFASLARYEQLEPNSPRSHILLGDIYRQRERYDDAQREYKAALALSPGSAAALLGLASAYYGDANIAKTIETAQEALRASPDDPDTNLLMGEALISQHDLSESEPFLLKALKAKPQMLPHVHALLGEAYAADGRTQDAIREMTLGASSDEDGSLHYRLARLYAKIGDRTKAEAAIEEMKNLEQKQRGLAAIAVKDANNPAADQVP